MTQTTEPLPAKRLRVKELLAEQAMSMGKLSRRAWLDPGTVRELCRNPYHRAKDSTFEKVACVLNVSIADLFEPG